MYYKILFIFVNNNIIVIYNIMKKKCLFFGNCQMHIIKEMLKTTKFVNLYDCDLFSSHMNTCNDLEKIYKKLNIYSIIFIQPHNNYRNNIKYNINSIVKYVNKDCKIIIIPSCYFNFYYPFLTYAYYEKEILKKPSDYHDKNLIDLYHNNIKNIKNEYIKLINDIELLTIEKMNEMANNSIDEMEKREEKFKNEDYIIRLDYIFITISNFIKENYKEKLLFYSMNHPTYYLFEYLVNEILKKINLNEYVDTFDFMDPLDNLHPPLYKCLEKVVNFDLNKFYPIVNNLIDIGKITDMYLNDYVLYKNIRY
jgi:hypothetical protein